MLILSDLIILKTICGQIPIVSPVDRVSVTIVWSQTNAIITLLFKQCTYSSFPRKEVSLHATFLVRTPEETLTEEDLCGCWSSSSLQPCGAVTGVMTPELTDVRSVLRSNDVQEESEEAEGLVSTLSSRNPPPRSMVQV